MTGPEVVLGVGSLVGFVALDAVRFALLEVQMRMPRDRLEGQEIHRVCGVYGDFLAEQMVDRWPSAAQRGMILDVVYHQRAGMQHLGDCCDQRFILGNIGPKRTLDCTVKLRRLWLWAGDDKYRQIRPHASALFAPRASVTCLQA